MIPSCVCSEFQFGKYEANERVCPRQRFTDSTMIRALLSATESLEVHCMNADAAFDSFRSDNDSFTPVLPYTRLTASWAIQNIGCLGFRKLGLGDRDLSRGEEQLQ
jgi:hypothetical protein